MIEIKAIAQHFGFNYYGLAHFAMAKPGEYQVDETGRYFTMPKNNMNKLINNFLTTVTGITA